MDRKYSVVEIDQMRQSVHASLRPAGREVSAAEIEDRLRTYMLNGTSPEELNEAFGRVIVMSHPAGFSIDTSPVVSAPCCEGGPQWGHAWDCPKLPD